MTNVMPIVLLSVGGSTVLGVLGGLLVRTIPHKLNDAVMGLAAGIMTGAAVLGLLVPAVSKSSDILPAVLGAFVGAALISMLDRIVPHLHHLAGVDTEEHRNNKSIGKTLLFISAIALHKIPEGLATGVSFGTGDMGDVLTVAGSISLQNIPEAIVIVAPLFAIGVKTGRTILIALGIAVISVISVLTGNLLVSVFAGILPFMLASAGGAMMYVISDEMIPETHSHGNEKMATFALLAGLLFVLIMQCIFSGIGK